MALWWWFVSGFAAVGLAEVLPNPDGEDTDREWVELWVSEDTDLSGFRIEGALHPGAWFEVWTLPEGSFVLAGSRVLLAGEAADLADTTVFYRRTQHAQLGNAGSNTDALRLVDPEGVVLDQLVYGKQEEGFEVQWPRVSAPKSGASLELGDDGLWRTQSTPTPGLAPYHEPPDVQPPAQLSACTPLADALLNEFVPDPVGADDDAEWVEVVLHEQADLSGWHIDAATREGSWKPVWLFPAGTGGFSEDHLVFAGTRADLPEESVMLRLAQTASLGNAGSSAAAVRLVDTQGCVVDEVAYGKTQGSEPFVDAWGEPFTADRLAPVVRSGASLARAVDGIDTRSPQSDWVVSDAPSPGLANPNRQCEPGSDVKISEILANPVGRDAEGGQAFVELWVGGQGQNLAGWSLLSRTSSNMARQLVRFEPDTWAPAGRWWVVGGPGVADADVVVEGLDPANGDGGDAIELMDCEGVVVDRWIYGGSNRDGLQEDGGDVPEVVAPLPKEGECLGRLLGEPDTDHSATDIVKLARCTPGFANEAPEASGGAVEGGSCLARAPGDPGLPSAPRRWMWLGVAGGWLRRRRVGGAIERA